MDVSFFARLLLTATLVGTLLLFLVDLSPSEEVLRLLRHGASAALFIAVASGIGVIWTAFA